MASVTDTGIEAEDARRKFLQATIFNKLRFLASVERVSDEIYSVVIPSVFDGKDHLPLEFRRWTHQQASRFYKLPFIDKFESKATLTDEEKVAYEEFQKMMVLDSILDKQRWKDLVETNPQFTRMVFDLIAKTSGVDREFEDRLGDFVDSDFGLAYGQIWFLSLGKMPSDIATMPESDYKTVMAWMQKWIERVNKK